MRKRNDARSNATKNITSATSETTVTDPVTATTETSATNPVTTQPVTTATFQQVQTTTVTGYSQEDIIPSSIPIFRTGDDNHSLVSLQRSDVSTDTNSSGLSYLKSLASRDPPGKKEIDPQINQYQTFILHHLKEAQTSIEQWTSRAVESVKDRLTKELSKFYSHLHTMEKTV